MQTVLENNYNQIFIPNRAGVIHFKFEFDDGPRKMTSDEFWEFCAQNRNLHAELTMEGEVIIMPPTGFETSNRNADLNAQLYIWAKQDGSGEVTDSNGGFILPNGAVYAPDASWTSRDRLEQFTPQQLTQFLPLCPDFVIEMTSPSDSLSKTQGKMLEYIENGAKLGWLIHSETKQVFIYRQGRDVEILKDPTKVSGEDVLKGFELDLTDIW